MTTGRINQVATFQPIGGPHELSSAVPYVQAPKSHVRKPIDARREKIAWYKTTTTGLLPCACGNYTTNHHRDESRGADFFQSPLRTYPRCRASQNGRIARVTNSVLRCTDTVLHGALRHRLVAHAVRHTLLPVLVDQTYCYAQRNSEPTSHRVAS